MKFAGYLSLKFSHCEDALSYIWDAFSLLSM